MARRKRASELWSAPTVPPDWRPKIATREDLEPLIDRLPASPGVYVMRDREGHVVYVGKARKLKQRVRQYFSGHDPRYFVPLLGDLLGDIETIVGEITASAHILTEGIMADVALACVAGELYVPLDQTKVFHPLSEQPATNACFYLCSEEIFGKEDARIAIDLTQADPSTVAPAARGAPTR